MGTQTKSKPGSAKQKSNYMSGPQIPSQAVQDKQTELHMTGHKKWGPNKI